MCVCSWDGLYLHDNNDDIEVDEEVRFFLSIHLSEVVAMSQDSAIRKLIKSHKFWVSTAIATSGILIFYDWYKDRYALPTTRYFHIQFEI